MLEDGFLTYAEVNNIAPAPIARSRKAEHLSARAGRNTFTAGRRDRIAHRGCSDLAVRHRAAVQGMSGIHRGGRNRGVERMRSIEPRTIPAKAGAALASATTDSSHAVPLGPFASGC